MRTSLSDTGIQGRGISDVIYMLDWTEAPLVNLFGFGDENMNKVRPVNWPATKLEWIEDTMRPFTSALSAGINNSTTTIPVTSTHGVYFRKGDIIKINAEKMLVVSVSGDNLTVATRPYGTTSAASHSSADAVTILTRAMPEGNDFETGYTTVTTQPFNHSQIISEAAKVSGTQEAIHKYGITSEMDYQVAKLFKDGGKAGRLIQLLERTYFHGERVQRDTGNAYGSMGGLRTFLPPERIYDQEGKSLSKDAIHKACRQIWGDGGKPTDIITSAWGAEKIHDMYDGYRRYTQDATLGGSEVLRVRTPVAEVNVVIHHDMPDGETHVVDRNCIGWLPLRVFDVKEIKEQGDYWVRDVVGEYTFFATNGASHAIIENHSMTK